jgi:hypothetical protein
MVTILIAILAGCRAVGGGGSPVETPTPTPAPAVIEFSTMQDGCCWTEGALSYATLDGPTRVEELPLEDRVDRDFDMNKPMVIGVRKVTITPGHYTLTVWQRPCDGNCGYLDPPTGQATAEFDVTAGQELSIRILFSLMDSTAIHVGEAG